MATPADVARTFNVTAMTVRRWCAAHAAYLSPGANPPHQGTRKLTPRDVEVLRTVAELRAQGQTAAQVNAQLADLKFPEVDDGAQENAQEAPGARVDDREGIYTALVRLSVVEAAYGADRERWEQERREFERRLEDLQREIGRLEGSQAQRPAWWRKLFG